MVPALVDCGSFDLAEQVFNNLSWPNSDSWTALVRGFNNLCKFKQAQNVLERMEAAKMPLSCHTFQAFVKTSISLKDFVFGRSLHTEIMKRGYDSNQIIGVTLIEMYVKCEAHYDAWAVLQRLPAHDVIPWNILIMDYADNGLSQQAWECLELMKSYGLSPDNVTFMGTLKASTIAQDVSMGRDIHSYIVKFGFEEDTSINNTLVDMYMKVGLLDDAQKVFNEIPEQTTVSWNALLSGYAEQGLQKEVLSSLDKMQSQGLSFSHVTVTCGLSCCTRLLDIVGGCDLHSEAVKLGLELFPTVTSSLIEMYMSFGQFDEGQHIFEMLPVRNLFCWTALITGYIQHGHFVKALDGFTRISSEGVSPDALLYVCLLECSCKANECHRVFEIHCEIAKDGLELDALVADALVDTYTTIGLLLEAHCIFDELPLSEALMCNVSPAWYVEYSNGCETLLSQVEEMLMNGTFFTSSMLLGSLKVCMSFTAIDVAFIIHMKVVSQGFEKDFPIGIALVSLYAKCGWFVEAHCVHEGGLPETSVSSWNGLLSGYAEHSMADQVLICFKAMQKEGIRCNEVTFTSCMKACVMLEASRESFELHIGIVKEELEKDLLVGNSLVTLYAKLGLLSEALDVFTELPLRDAVSWNSLMAGYTDFGLDEEVLNWWEKMQNDYILPNSISFTLCLKACSNAIILQKGLILHEEIILKGLESNAFLGKAIVELYSKSGLLVEAWQSFKTLPSHGLAMWNALIGGFACCGRNDLICNVLEGMQSEEVDPDEQTYLHMLTLCKNGGMLDEGYICFQYLHLTCFLSVLSECYNCMIDLLGRAGQLSAAFVAMEFLPFHPDLVTWRTILGASRKWRNLDLGRHAFMGVMGMSRREVAAYVLLLNMYGDFEED
ncbi:hypothetical protein KP509_15G026200 [Ceratopteris richardii]|nr:hypothetical protein KP509_15G026200 [Ceratopteris richardii]